ncbi:MAG: hypothetical protein ACLFQV_10965 [Vulcanimicrobiota bacterium]
MYRGTVSSTSTYMNRSALEHANQATKAKMAQPQNNPSVIAAQAAQTEAKNPKAVIRQPDIKKNFLYQKKNKGAVIQECQTCRNRRYVDGSSDGSVSFQTPTHIPASMAGNAVLSHEMEHVSHETADAQRDGREVVHKNVMLHQSVCPECGRLYISGGTTEISTAPKKDAQTYKPVDKMA